MRTSRAARASWLILLTLAAACTPRLVPPPGASGLPPRVLHADDVPAVADLLQLEDERLVDSDLLLQSAASPSAEVRRRTALTMGRLRWAEGMPVLLELLVDPDTAVAATAAFALGHLGDTLAVPALVQALTDGSRRSVTVAAEAAAALGKLPTAAGGDALIRVLGETPLSAADPMIAEALLAIWRYPRGPDLSPLARWAAAPDAELRWRAAYAMVRRPDPAAVPVLMQLSADMDARVRSLAVRGLTGPLADTAGIPRRDIEPLLLQASEDPDYQVRISAIRSLGTLSGTMAIRRLESLLGGSDHAALAAAEGLGALGPAAASAAPALEEFAVDPRSPVGLRSAALGALAQVERARGERVAERLAVDPSWRVRAAAGRALARIGPLERAELAQLLRDPDPRVAGTVLEAAVDTAGGAGPPSRLLLIEAVASRDTRVRAAGLRGLARLRDPASLPLLLDAYQRSVRDGQIDAALAAIEALGALRAAGSPAANAFFHRFSRPHDYRVRQRAEQVFGDLARRHWGPVYPVGTDRPLEDYRELVHRFFIEAGSSRELPRAFIDTGTGTVEIELFAQDAPLTVENFLRLAEDGYFDGQEWPRVVPNFVLQGGDPRGDQTGGPGYAIRDEINRHRYLTGTVGMALSGPDTGGSQFFVTHSPQPHLDGGYTVFGRVVAGQETVEGVQMGERIHRVRVSGATGRTE
jgi:cyclophilin family peptidyl-prolyl cis-trans isomerase/HEAT repeat protein